MTELKAITNKQLLLELGRRIVQKRLELEGIGFDGLLKLKCSVKTHHVDILDNEWEDKTKPDYTGGRIGLVYSITEAKI